MLDFLLVGVSLVPLGLLLFFSKVFPNDCGIHPIYREPGIETIDKRSKVQDAAVTRRPPRREVERNGKVAQAVSGSPALSRISVLVRRVREFES